MSTYNPSLSIAITLPEIVSPVAPIGSFAFKASKKALSSKSNSSTVLSNWKSVFCSEKLRGLYKSCWVKSCWETSKSLVFSLLSSISLTESSLIIWGFIAIFSFLISSCELVRSSCISLDFFWESYLLMWSTCRGFLLPFGWILSWAFLLLTPIVGKIRIINY